MKDRTPTDFETKIMSFIYAYGRIFTGNKSVANGAAARRLEKLGYAGQIEGPKWLLTTKGKEWLVSQGIAR